VTFAWRQETTRLPMPDGVELATEIYRPAAAGRFPALVMRTPYGREAAETIVYSHPSRYTSQGFAVVVQDVRGRGGSGGAFDPFASEQEDGAETVDWCAQQPWSNGRVGMYGFSYPGVVQLAAAAARPPGLRAIAPALAPAELGEGLLFSGGAFALGFALGWAIDLGFDCAVREGRRELADRLLSAASDREHQYRFRPLREHPLLAASGATPFYSEWFRHEPGSDYWQSRSVRPAYAEIATPSLHTGGLFDPFLDATLDNYRGLVESGASEHRLLVGPWLHYPGASAGAITDDSRRTFEEAQLAFFRQLLQDEESGDATARVRVYVTGGVGWQSLPSWPPETDRITLYLGSDGRANTVSGGGVLTDETSAAASDDVFVYDPRAPICAADLLGPTLPLLTPAGPVDQAEVEHSTGVLVYSSAPLERDVTVLGRTRVVLHAWSSAIDTDFVATICDVDRHARSINVARGIRRARSVLGGRGASDDTAEYAIELNSVAHRFRSGHRIRLQVTSSCFPCWEPNPNTGAPLGTDHHGELVVATQVLSHGAGHPSRVELPVLELG
jgi:putative CocE/NonD family hydrolase